MERAAYIMKTITRQSQRTYSSGQKVRPLATTVRLTNWPIQLLRKSPVTRMSFVSREPRTRSGYLPSNSSTRTETHRLHMSSWVVRRRIIQVRSLSQFRERDFQNMARISVYPLLPRILLLVPAHSLTHSVVRIACVN